ncbi:hypothetical protein D3C74_171540 [compost metagenome]
MYIGPKSALDELSGILAYPPEVKERIYFDSFDRLQYTPTLTAKQIENGTLHGLWVRLGLYQVILVIEVDEEAAKVWIYGVKHKRENAHWKRSGR